MREVRTWASEIKFVVDSETAARIRTWAREHLARDPHGAGPFGDEYRIASVYFDTAEHDVFHRRGSFGRSKYRIRRYGENDVVFLERKLREPRVLAKRRTVADLTALKRLAEPLPDGGWAGRWFHERLLVRRLHPVCQVDYIRTARVSPEAAELVRLTLDDAVHVIPTTVAAFESGPGTPVIGVGQILELKFRWQLPSIFKRLVEELTLIAQPASKYRLAMAALGQVPTPGSEPALRQLAGADGVEPSYV